MAIHELGSSKLEMIQGSYRGSWSESFYSVNEET
jgi:hypothetical protein